MGCGFTPFCSVISMSIYWGKYSRLLQGGVAALETEFESGCHELFFALATGIKLNFLLSGQNINEDVSTLYASVKQQGLHFSRFNAFLRRNLVPEKP